jgi:hypothetical protein
MKKAAGDVMDDDEMEETGRQRKSGRDQ